MFDTNGRAIGWSVSQSTGGTAGLTSYVICADVAAVSAPPPNNAPLSVTPSWTANEDNTVSSTVPGNGQHTYTFQANGLTGTLAFAVVSSANIVQNANSTYSFCDTNTDRKADSVGQTSTFITQINGVFVTPTNVARFIPIPANGTITITIDSAARNQRVRVVGWQDKSGDGQIDLTAAGDVNCENPQLYDTVADGAIAVSGRKFYFGPEGTFGAQFPDASGNPGCVPVFRHDAANQVFSAGPTSATSLRYTYDPGDSFRVLGAVVTIDQFKGSLTASSGGSADKVQITYVPGGTSEFNICLNLGFTAPSDLATSVADFDGGLTPDDVKVTFTSPLSNSTTSYPVQRAALGVSTAANATNCNLNAVAPAPSDATGLPGGTSFTNVGTATGFGLETLSFIDHDVANGGYCYRIVVTDTVLGPNSFSNYAPANVTAGAPPSLTVTPAFAAAVDNTVSSAVPGDGQHTFSFHAANLSGTLSFTVFNSAFATQNADGTFGFCDTNGDHQADLGGGTFIVSINGITYAPTNTVVGVAIPASGDLNVVIDTATRNQRVRVVGWQDKNANGQIDLTAAGDSNCDAYTNYDSARDGLLALSGRKFYFGPEAPAGLQPCAQAWRHDPTNQAVSIGATSATSLRFNYDANDTFHVQGNAATLDQFKASVTASTGVGVGDTISVNYAPGGVSDFNICSNLGGLAPTDLAATVGSFDGGTAADDVNLTFTTPVPNFTVSTYTVERASLGASTTATSGNCNLNAAAGSTSDATGVPSGASFTTVGVVTKFSGEAAVFTDNDLAAGGYCYRITTADPVFPVTSFSNYAPANIAAPPPPPGTIAATPDYTINEDNTVSTTVPGSGQHTYTFTTQLTGNLSFAAVNSSVIVRNADGTFAFCDTDQNGVADGVGTANAYIVQINGLAVAPAQVVRNQAIPANGRVTVTIDSAVRNTRVRVIAWQDLNNDGQIGLAQIGDLNCDSPQPNSASDGALTVSGRKFFFGPEGSFGPQFPDAAGNPQCEPVYRHDAANQVFSAGPTSATSLRYTYDATDTFRVVGALVTLDQFKSSLTASSSGSADSVKITYVPGGASEFNICVNKGATAPTDLAASIGNFNGGPVADDVRLTWIAPGTNVVSVYNIQRASGSLFGGCTNPNPPNDGSIGTPPNSAFATVGTATANAGEQGIFIDFNVAFGSYCYRVTAQDAVFGTSSASNYLTVNVIGGSGDTTPPVSTSAALTTVAGLANTLEQGDRFVIDFVDTGCGPVCGMIIGPNAVIRVTDSDCGPATNAGPAICAGGNTNTTADIVCGTNAICSVQSVNGQQNNELLVILTMNPTIVAPGSLVGMQLPVVVADSSGITDLSGNAWNLATSPDRTIEPPSTAGPVSTSARQTASGGFANTLDTGDALTIDFSQAVSLAANAVIRVTDSDCGGVTNAGPALCAGGNTNTVADIVCGLNATCALTSGPNGANTEIVITMTGNTSIVAAGSVAGPQVPVVVTDSSGIGGVNGPWNLNGSQDRVFGPLGN